jgi:hypothetical protein
MKQHGLPPLVGGFSDGKVTWQRIESIDYDTLGYLLSCHLIIEHYLDHLLATHPGADFGWEGARLTFGQKVALISGLKFPEPYNFPPAIKHLNTLRNRFGHNINAKLSEEDLLPLRQLLVKCTEKSGTPDDVPSEPKEVLSLFTSLACTYFAGAIWHRARFVGTER